MDRVLENIRQGKDVRREGFCCGERKSAERGGGGTLQHLGGGAVLGLPDSPMESLNTKSRGELPRAHPNFATRVKKKTKPPYCHITKM